MKLLQTDCLVIGSGLAGSIYALKALNHGLSCVMLSGEEDYASCNSNLAQGGIVYDIANNPDLFKYDIQMATADTASMSTVSAIIDKGPRIIDEILIDLLKVPFDREKDSENLCLTKEAAHSMARIIFCKDQTGKAILQTLHTRLQQQQQLVKYNNCLAIDLLTLSHSSDHYQDVYKPLTCFGAYVLDTKKNEVFAIKAKKTILATGGLGQIFQHTTNFSGAFGHGIAMAYRIGARVMNMEYVQFHPTVFFRKGGVPFLVSETVRGEGGVLVNDQGQRFMDAIHPLGSLAPRDIIARGIHEELIKGNSDSVFINLDGLDPTFIQRRFPHISQKCLEYGVDITSQPIPVVPAAHYLCGGIFADIAGRTSILNLNAIGETACTGLHGANRLASTSLLEGLVMGYLAADQDKLDIDSQTFYLPPISDWKSPGEQADEDLIQQDLQLIKNTMWNYVGLVRSHKRLARAKKILGELKNEIDDFYSECKLTKRLLELRNAVQNALLIVYAASRNKVSRGCHYRVGTDK